MEPESDDTFYSVFFAEIGTLIMNRTGGSAMCNEEISCLGLAR